MEENSISKRVLYINLGINKIEQQTKKYMAR
jgi:hypothetical protein